MTASIVHEDDWLTVIQGDCREGLRLLPDASVHTVCTSPPFFGLRDYRLPPTVWGGDPEHEHLWYSAGVSPQRIRHGAEGGLHDGRPGYEAGTTKEIVQTGVSQGESCACGAWRGTLGLEPTPDMYVDHLVEVFREVRRVLRPDGTVWLNLGDSYNNRVVARKSSHQTGLGFTSEDLSKSWSQLASEGRTRMSLIGNGLKEKDLIGVPWMAAFALRADGWHLRADVVWAKPNAMPESVEDRPTRSHEFIFLFTKEPRYFYDYMSIKEPPSESTKKTAEARMNRPIEDRQYQHDSDTRMGKRSPNRVWSDPEAMGRLLEGRNRRDVWTVATRPYAGAHYAVFPPELVEPMVKAGTSERGCCVECGAPWERDVTVVSTPAKGRELRPNRVPGQGYAQQSGNYWTPPEVTDNGWKPGCAHEAASKPCVVLDPFGGSGTVGMVAQSLSRRAILIDLNGDYIKQQFERNAALPLGLTT